MLILARRLYEEIYLETSDGRVTVRVTELRDGRVQLGFDAPLSVRIDRREVTERRLQGERKHDDSRSADR